MKDLFYSQSWWVLRHQDNFLTDMCSVGPCSHAVLYVALQPRVNVHEKCHAMARFIGVSLAAFRTCKKSQSDLQKNVMISTQPEV